MNARRPTPARLGTLLACLALAACDGGGGPVVAPTPPDPVATLQGRIVDQNGSPISDVTVATLGAELAPLAGVSNEQGFFAIDGVAPGVVAVQLAAPRHVGSTKLARIADGELTRVAFALQRVGASLTVDPTMPNTLTHAGGSATIPAGAIVDGGGAPVESATVALTTLAPGDPSFTAVVPGEFRGMDDGAPVLVECLGVLDVTFADLDGNALQLASGAMVDISFPIPTPDPAAQQVPLWSLDVESAQWNREGDAERDDQAGVYRARVPHLAPWCLATAIDEATQIVVLTYEGAPVIGATVRIDGDDGRWSVHDTTNTNGEASLRVAAGREATIAMLLPDGTWLTLATAEPMPPMGETATRTFTAADGIVQSLATITLTWDAFPRDLDLHVTIPPATAGGARRHMFHAARGALAQQPFAHLDTDDVTSFGPEIVTLAQLLPGTYRIAVHNYSGNTVHPLQASGAHVVLQLRGLPTRSFAVPTRNPDQAGYWAVFDLVVDAHGAPTVVRLDTFGPESILLAPMSAGAAAAFRK
ncbi:MAG: hypothetical protein IPM29_04740 [Planctomycetes bacterium]|nr:hypothetical protein [Planctomycetota bacterium]